VDVVVEIFSVSPNEKPFAQANDEEGRKVSPFTHFDSNEYSWHWRESESE